MLRLVTIAALLGSLSLIGCASSKLPTPVAAPGIAASIPSNEIRPRKPLPIQWVQGERVPSSMQDCRDIELRLESIRVQSDGTTFLGTLVNRANEPRTLRPLPMLRTVWGIVVRTDEPEQRFAFVRARNASNPGSYELTPVVLAPGEERPVHVWHLCVLIDPDTKQRPPAGVYRARWEILYSVNDIEYEDYVKVCATDDNVVTVYVDPETAPAANAPK